VIKLESSNNRNTTIGGVGFAGLLTITFIVLKLIGVINWSWVWVLSPLWISAILTIILCIIIFLVALQLKD